MNGSIYLKLASAARDFAKQDDIWQAMDADETTREVYHRAIGLTPKVLAEAAILMLGVTRCAMMNALDPLCTACKKPKVPWKDQCNCDSDDSDCEQERLTHDCGCPK